jgi:tetratricopeptide (TPR) repeat protein
MPKRRTDDLVQLIRSLSKAEKRHFRLFAQRNQPSDVLLFLQLFDHLDKYGEYEEAEVLRRIPEIKKSQLPNLKAHLTRQLLTSLRLLNKSHNQDIQIREQIDYARLLYNKGLYSQSLDWLSKAKLEALAGNYTIQALEAVEFEKLIESQYITNSLEGRAEELTVQSLRLTTMATKSGEFSSLALQMYGLYLKNGFARNRKDYLFVREFFRSRLPATHFDELDFIGKLYYCQAHVWLHQICQEFAACFRYTQKWVDLFDKNPDMIALHPALYLKGLHNLLSTLYHSLHYDRFMVSLPVLEQFPETLGSNMDNNVEGLYYLYHFIHRINRHYLEGTYAEGLKLVPELLSCLDNETYNWDKHRIMVFYYRIACLYFANRDYNHAIDYLNRIINTKNPNYREDIQCFSRILCLISHFELGNEQLLEYQIKSVYRFLLQMEDLHEVQKEIFRFLRRTPGMRRAALLDEFRKLHTKLVLLEEDAFERRPFMYLDIISWLETKIENRVIEDIVQEKFEKRRKSNKVKSEE